MVIVMEHLSSWTALMSTVQFVKCCTNVVGVDIKSKLSLGPIAIHGSINTIIAIIQMKYHNSRANSIIKCYLEQALLSSAIPVFCSLLHLLAPFIP